MRDLAASPHTARHVSTKLAAHFVSDDPPPALVAKLEKTYLDSGGRLDEMARALITAPEAWDPAPPSSRPPTSSRSRPGGPWAPSRRRSASWRRC
jgi:uncharacterized protein (DUF1800 family)